MEASTLKKYYSQEEQKLQENLAGLFCDWSKCWKNYCKNNPSAHGVDEDHTDIVLDGFYPNYLKQKLKILFIGRECYTMGSGADYIETFIGHYLAGRTGAEEERSINRDKFHKLLLKVAYGLVNDMPWEDIPKASELCADQKIFDRISFAFMNISKLSNELVDRETTNTDWKLVNTSLDMSLNSGRNFLYEEIQLLDPDLIISMYIDRNNPRCQTLLRIFGNQFEMEEKDYLGYTIRKNHKKICLIDQYHFSQRCHKEQEIYNDIRNAYHKFKSR